MFCKNKLFKKLLIFSSLFLILSFFYYKVTCANAQVAKQNNKQISHVKVQQEKIISSLKKIESRIGKKNVSIR